MTARCSRIGEQALAYGVRMTKRVFDDAKLTDHHAIIPTGKRGGSRRI